MFAIDDAVRAKRDLPIAAARVVVKGTRGVVTGVYPGDDTIYHAVFDTWPRNTLWFSENEIDNELEKL
jgi:hypothetical protein